MQESQETLYKLIKLVRLLESGSTMERLVDELDTNKRSVYRYLTTLKSLSFNYQIDKAKRYYLETTPGDVRLKLNTEEREFLIQLLILNGDQLSLSDSILTKIDSIRAKANSLNKENRLHLYDVVLTLKSAIQQNKKVELEYLSGSRGLVKQVIIEPIRFTDSFKYLLVYASERNQFENLKTIRIKKVKLVDATCSRKVGSDEGVDVFHMAYNGTKHPIDIRLTNIAWRVMVEENPESTPYIYDHDGPLFVKGLRCQLANFLPIGRFILGFPGEVQVIENDDLKKYLKNKYDAQKY